MMEKFDILIVRQDKTCLWQLYGDQHFNQVCYDGIKQIVGEMQPNEGIKLTLDPIQMERLGLMDIVIHKRTEAEQ